MHEIKYKLERMYKNNIRYKKIIDLNLLIEISSNMYWPLKTRFFWELVDIMIEKQHGET